MTPAEESIHPLRWIRTGPFTSAPRDYYLYAINSDGSLKWRYRAGNYLDSSPVIGGDGTIYIGCRNHQLYAVNADGTFQWSYTTGDDIRSSPAVGNERKNICRIIGQLSVCDQFQRFFELALCDRWRHQPVFTGYRGRMEQSMSAHWTTASML